MKKNVIRTLAVASAATALFSSCSGKLRPVTKEQVRVDPETLAVVGEQVPARIHIGFPRKSFPKKATLRITPVLRYAGGEKWGESVSYQGDKIYGNDIVIPYKHGANVVINFSLPYTPAMYKSDLYLSFQGKKGSSTVKLPDLKVASGVVSTEALATVTGIAPAIAPDGFERVIKESYDSDIMFQIQQSNVRASELQKGEVQEWKDIVQNAKETPNQQVSVEVQSYASPDGGKKLNEKLSQAREQSTSKALKGEFKKQKMSDVNIDTHYTAQDWEGFKRLVEQSNLQDKDLVLRVLSMYPDPESREREIRNISAIFGQLADEVLPKLRRSRLIANVEIIGKSDEEIQKFVAQAPGHLTIEELLYAATLTDSSEEKIRIYQLVNKIFPKDYRAYNNIGAVLFADGRPESAETWFKKAASLSDNGVTKMNLGLLELLKGDKDKASSLIALANDIPEAGQALGYLYLKQGKYAEAVSAFGSTVSNNAAVAQILAGDYSKALGTLSAIAKPTAQTYLIKAVASARTENLQGVLDNLRQLASLDPGLLIGLEDNLEFAKYLRNPEFMQLVSSSVVRK